MKHNPPIIFFKRPPGRPSEWGPCKTHRSRTSPPPQKVKKKGVICLDKTKDERIKAEIKRLKAIFAKLSAKEKKFLEPLIQRAAYMKIQLEDYEKDLLENGYVEMFSQSDKQAPYERERPVARLYTTLNGNYHKIMKQLSDHIEHVPVKEKSDGFEEFVNSR